MKKVNLFIALIAIAVFAFGFISKHQTDSKVGINIGNTAPDLSYKSPDGKVITLSQVNKGHLVLIDFWASWCGPCRMESPALVSAYNNYKDTKFKGGAKGFTIYSVSLDRAIEPWKLAIEKDGLSWKNHVSDLGMWQSEAARKYQIQSIPANWLIDQNGVIIARGLRGAALEAELAKYKK